MQVLQGQMLAAGALVEEHRMPLVERPGRHILPLNRTNIPSHSKEPKASLRRRPIDRALALRHFGALLEQLLQFDVHREAFRRPRQCRTDLGQAFGGDPSVDFVLGLVRTAEVAIPPGRQLAQDRLLLDRAPLLLLGDQIGADSLFENLQLGRAGADGLRIGLPQHRTRLDLRVQKRLRRRRIVHFAVAVAAVADQIHHDIGADSVRKSAAMVPTRCTASGSSPVDVEDGHREPLATSVAKRDECKASGSAVKPIKLLTTT